MRFDLAKSVPVLTISILGSLASAQTYQYIDLGSLVSPSFSSSARDINSSGQVTGQATYSTGQTHAFIYSGGTFTSIGDLGGHLSYGMAINDSGEVAGISFSSSASHNHAFKYTGGVTQDLGTLGGVDSYGYGINAAGHVVGDAYSTNPSGDLAFFHNGTSMSSLGSLPGGDNQSFAQSINSSGQIAGYARTSTGDKHPVLFSGGGITDLGTLGGTSGEAHSINDAGQIVGYARNASGSDRAFLYSGGVMQDLGVLPGTIASQAHDINSNGWIVGQVTVTGTTTHGFLYRNGAMVDLNTIANVTGGWTITRAYGINDDGWIVGEARSGLTNHAILLQTPEPATFVVLGIPLLLALKKRKRQR